MMDYRLNQVIAENRSAFYVFDIAVLKGRIAFLKKHLPSNVSLCYAIKANPFIAKEIAEDVDRFEICSPGETHICRTFGIATTKQVISGVYKTPELIDALISNANFEGVFTVESMQQYRMLKVLAQKYKRKLPVLLRLTNGSQFGINESDIEEIIKRESCSQELRLLGIQYFSGTQKVLLKKYRREIEYLDSFLFRLREIYGYEAEELEYGPGFPYSYFVSDDWNEEELLSYVSELINDMVVKPKITLELGRSIAASCGRYYTHIVDLKRNKEQNYALVDGGMHHLVYFGQHMAMKQPFLSVCGKETMVCRTQWNVCGSLCSMNDIMVKQISFPDIEVGDVLCFENTGAYCMTEGIALFLTRELPAVYLIKENGEPICVRKACETAKINTANYERN